MTTEPASRHPFALGTFSISGSPGFPGLVLGEAMMPLHALRPLAARIGARLGSWASVFDLLQDWEANFASLSALVAALADDAVGHGYRGAFTDIALVDIQAPVSLPRQIFCNGANYRKHVMDLIIDQGDPSMKAVTLEEKRAHATRLMDERALHGIPYVFTKLPSCVIGPRDKIIVPADVIQCDWELELGVVFGRTCRHVARADALSCVAGYMVVNDITTRERIYRPDLKALGTDWLAGKSSPTYLPTGPFLVPAAFIENPQNLDMRLSLNGDVMQDANTDDMIFDVARQIEYITQHCLVLAGDLLCTGSPHGNGTHYKRFLEDGDIVEATIAGLGVQTNNCIREKRS